PLYENARPVEEGDYHSGNDSLNTLLNSFGVYKYVQSFPGAKTPEVDSIYEIHAAGNIDTLKIALENTGLFKEVNKTDYYVADCQQPHGPLSDAVVTYIFDM